MEVVDWISYDAADKNKKPSFGGPGGWFGEKDGQRWPDYIEQVSESGRPYAEAIRRSVLENDIKHTGDDHQNASDGVPLFSDGTVALFSMRGWGDILAAIWSSEEGRDIHYMEFYSGF